MKRQQTLGNLMRQQPHGNLQKHQTHGLLVTQGEARSLAKKHTNMHLSSHEAAMRFAEYDKDGDQKLDWEEFLAMQPQRLRDEYSNAEIRQWFDAADTNGDGDLSINEFFLWTLGTLASEYGSAAIEAAFAKFDDNGSGVLDAVEFEKMCVALGVGAGANAIFKELDDNGSGSVSYNELLEALGQKRSGLSTDAQRVLAQAMWTSTADITNEGPTSKSPNLIDTRGWKVTARDVAGVKEQIRKQINDSGAHVADVLRLFDMDAGSERLIDDVEFLTGMKTYFGWAGNAFVIRDVFHSIDTDGSGAVGFDELYEFLRGKRHSLDKRSKRVPKHLPVYPPDGVTLAEIAWDVEVLRAVVGERIAEHDVSAATLMAAWDHGGDGKLNQEEFTNKLRETFFCTEESLELWQAELHAIAAEAFVLCAGRAETGGGAGHLERQVDALELHTWLNRPSQVDLDALPLKVEVNAWRKKTGRVKLQARLTLRAKEAADRAAATRAEAEAAEKLKLTGTHGRPMWQMPTPRDHIPPVTALPPLPSPWSPRPIVKLEGRVAASRAGRVCIKPIFHPIRPLQLPFVASASGSPRDAASASARGTTSGATAAAMSRMVSTPGSDARLTTAEKRYAQLCCLKEADIIQPPSSPREVHERSRRLRESSASLCHVYNELSSACLSRNECEQAQALLQRARTCAATAESVALSVTTLANTGVCWLRRHNPSTAATTLKEAIKLDTAHADAPGLTDEARSHLRLNLCAALCQCGVYSEALTAAESAVEIAARCDDVTLALALHQTSVVHEYLGQNAKGHAAAERALGLARANLPVDDKLLRRLEEVVRALE